MTENKPKLKLPLKPRILGIAIPEKANEETKSKANNSPTSPKAAKVVKVQQSKNKIISSKIYFKILKYFQAKYPNCFCLPMKTLAIGIHKELLSEREEIGVSGVELRNFFRAYCRNPKYTSLIIIGAERVNLKGEVVSLVTEHETRKPVAKSVKKEE